MKSKKSIFRPFWVLFTSSRVNKNTSRKSDSAEFQEKLVNRLWKMLVTDLQTDGRTASVTSKDLPCRESKKLRIIYSNVKRWSNFKKGNHCTKSTFKFTQNSIFTSWKSFQNPQLICMFGIHNLSHLYLSFYIWFFMHFLP